MIPRIRELLHATPFMPFTIRTSDGREYVAPTADHAAINPKGSLSLSSTMTMNKRKWLLFTSRRW